MALDVEEHYLRHGPMVLRRCRALLRSDSRAEDAMQDVFVALLRFGDGLRDEAPGALLLRIATNLCLNRLRSERRRPEDPADALVLEIAAQGEAGGGAGVEAQVASRSLLGKLFGADDPLAASTGSLAVMHLYDGMTLEEVARESGLSVSGVRKRLRRLRGRLAELEGA